MGEDRPRWEVAELVNAEDRPRWEVAELVNALDPTIAPRLLAAHPARGWCRSCRAAAPCSLRRLATLAAATSLRGLRP